MSDRIYKIKPKYILREIAGEYLAIPLGAGGEEPTSQIIILNEVSSLFWSKLEKGATADELVAAVTAEFDVSAEEAAQDAAEFLESLEKSGFLE